MAVKDDAFKNIDKKNYTVPVSNPTNITDIDTDGSLYSYMIDSMDSSTLDLSELESLINVSRARDQVYNLIDLMAEDPRIAAALNIYASDVCEPNDKGEIVWCESDDAKIANYITYLLNALNIDKNSYKWVYSLCKYGDLYLRLYRESDFNTFDRYVRAFKKQEPLNEDLKINAYYKNDKYVNYIEFVKNPAEMFDLTMFGKTYGFVKSNVPISNQRVNDTPLNQAYTSSYKYSFNQDDQQVELYEATEFAHASLENSFDRTSEEVSLNSGDDSLTFDVKKGQSVLYDAFKIWRELQLLENAVLLNRVTKSSVVRAINVELGDMERTEANKVLQRIKMMFEQKSAIRQASSFNEYTNPGPMENTIYVPVHEGKGAISPQEIGGNAEAGDLGDLDWWKKKLFASIGIPGQYLGDTDDNTGFNGGTSLSLISSRYAKTIKHIQNIYVQAITDVINLILLDSGNKSYINQFTIKMQAPTTQEEKDRKDNLNTSLSVIQSVMGLLDTIEDPAKKLEIVKALLSDVLNNNEVIEIIQDVIDQMNANNAGAAGGGEAGGGGMDMGGGDFGGGGDMGGDLGMGAADMLAPEDTGESEPMGGGEDMGGGEEPAPAEGGAEESFYSGRGSSVLNERDYLPSWNDMNLSYTQFPTN